jgi:hypothetical protein
MTDLPPPVDLSIPVAWSPPTPPYPIPLPTTLADEPFHLLPVRDQGQILFALAEPPG